MRKRKGTHKSWLYEEISGGIIGAAYKVFDRLGRGHLEHDYLRALVIELCSEGREVCAQVRVRKCYGDQESRLDMLVDQAVAVEIKRVARIRPRDIEQLRMYLRQGGWAVGLILNFGAGELEIRRVYEPSHDLARRTQ